MTPSVMHFISSDCLLSALSYVGCLMSLALCRCDTMEELKQWVTALAKGGIQASEGAPGLFWPSPTLIGGQVRD